MQEGDDATAAGILAGEHDGGGHLLHGQVADVAAQLAPTRGAARELRPAIRAHQMARMALSNKDEISAAAVEHRRGRKIGT
jgi:hypothetical protein